MDRGRDCRVLPAKAQLLLATIKRSQQAQGLLATVASAVTLLIAATTVLSALETLVEQIWKSEALASLGIRGWIRTHLLSLGVILILGFLLLVSLTISTAISTLQKTIGDQHRAAIWVIGMIDLLVSVSLIALLFALILPLCACATPSLEGRRHWRAANRCLV